MAINKKKEKKNNHLQIDSTEQELVQVPRQGTEEDDVEPCPPTIDMQIH